MARQPKYLMSTAELVKKIAIFCEAYSGITFYPYQSEWSNRMIRSMLENDGEELSALLARQCIPEGTLIHTREGGLVKIEDHPDSWLTNDEAEILELTINGGYTIRCTANHPIMTKEGWVQAGLLKKGDWAVVLDEWNCFGDGLITYSFTRYINKSRSDEVNLTYQMNDELAELVGWLTSDGYVNGKCQSIKFTNNNLNYLDRVEYLVTKYFPDIKPKRYAKGNGFDTLLTTGERSYKNSLKDFLRAMDYEEGFPKAVCKFTRSQVISFFKGMYASDGYVYQRKDGKNVEIGLSASNHFLYAQYCRELLNKLGIPAKIKRERMSKNKDGSLFNRVLITGQRNVLTFKNTIEIPDKPVPESNYSFMREVKTFEGEDGEILKYGLVNNIKKVDGTYKVYDVEYKDKGWFICSGVKVHNSGKSESVAVTCGGLMIILPTLANMPMFADDKRLQMFKNGLSCGIFAPSQRQAQTTYRKIKARIQSKTAQAVLSDPEFNLEFTVSNGTTVALSNGSFVTAISASDGANIEGESFHLIICEETQDISDFKLKKSILPMGSAYNATIVKIGTPSNRKGDFYEVIQRNKREYEEGIIKRRNHFEYNGEYVAKYNPKYAKALENAKKRLGENSDEYQISFNLKWILERGMFVDIEKFEQNNVMTSYDTVLTDKSATHVAGIDIGGGSDATVITICEVDWSMPVVMESRIDEETHEEIVYQCYNTYLKAWHMIQGVSDFEEQYVEIVDFLSRFKIARVVCDATKEKSIADRLNANLPYEVIPYVFSSKSKSDLYKHFDKEIQSGRVQIPGGERTQESAEYKRYMNELGNLEKTYRGSYLVVAHPKEKNAHDDYCDGHALAVWGCGYEGYVNQTETKDSKSLFSKSHNEKSYYSSRNKITARRR